ncbi:MAG: hypothetical protein EBU90_03790 [Proteobacteria bacterium]|nr:hypothetical protein [Pseudomonadota bacterium]NBP14190.1 hypothetical protein [bacterium]
MDIENILKITALIIGGLILLSNFVKVDAILAKLLPKKKNKPVTPTAPETTSNDDEKFLHIINLWYQLKESCDSYGLKLAVEKLDEVFPLLNNKVEETA